MSEILIKNIEFPKEGALTLMITSSGEVYRIPKKYDYIETATITESKAVELSDGVLSKRSLLDAFDNYGCPKERNTYLFKALRKLVEEAHEL